MDILFDVVQKLTNGMENYSRVIFEGLSPGCLTIFSTVFGCWFVWQLVYKGIMKGELDVREFVKYLLMCSLIQTFLQASHYFEWVYAPLQDVTSNLIQLIIKILVKDIQPKQANIVGILQAQYDALDHIFRVLSEMMKDSGFVNFMNPVASIILQFPFTFIYLMIICYVFKYMFSLMCVTALSPLLIIAAGFESTRPTTINALKMLAHGTLTLALSVVAMGAPVYALKEVAALIPIDEGGVYKKSITGFAFSMEYWACFIIACISIYLQLLCARVANISGFSDGPGAAAFVAGLGATAMAAGKALTLHAGGYIGGKAVGMAKGAWGNLKSSTNAALEKSNTETATD